MSTHNKEVRKSANGRNSRFHDEGNATIPIPLRIPPNNLDAEKGVLGGILIQPTQIREVRAILATGDFYREIHATIYQAMLRIVDSGAPLDAITLSDYMKTGGRHESIDDTFAELASSVPHGANATYHAQIVKEKAKQRQIIDLANAILSDSYSEKATSDEILRGLHHEIVSIGLPPNKKPYASLTLENKGVLDADKVIPESVDWLWKHRIARKHLNLIAGDGGLGKSQLLLSIATQISIGGSWQDGNGNAPIGNTLILSAEDQPSDTMVPRLMAMGADLTKIKFGNAVVKYSSLNGQLENRHFMSLRDTAYWYDVIQEIGDVKLMIIDPLPSFLGGGVNDSKNTEIREVLEPFIADVIAPLGIACLGNAHLNKSVDARTPVSRIMGSAAFANLPRSVSLVVRDPDNLKRRFFQLAKSNLAPDDLPAIGFTIEPRVIKVNGLEIETCAPVFEDELVEINLTEAVNGPAKSGKRGPAPLKTFKLAEWLWDYLDENGPTQLAKVITLAGNKGFLGNAKANGKFSTGLLYNAKDALPELQGARAGSEIQEFSKAIGGAGRELKHWGLFDHNPSEELE